jgi:hypothetical protein
MELQATETTAHIRTAARANAMRAKYYEDLDEIKASHKTLRQAKAEDCGYITFTDEKVTVDTLIAPMNKHSNVNHRIRGGTYADNITTFLARPKRGTYLFNLHDVNNVPESIGFGHTPTTHAAIIPDFYQMNNYNGNLEKKDMIPFRNKMSEIIFAGASTGSEGYDMRNNDRINYCKYAAERRLTDLSMCHFHITSVVQCTPQEMRRYLKSDDVMKHIIKQPIEQSVQKEYRYIFSIDGNAAAWDRPIWIMNSNSLLMQAPAKYLMWYSPFLHDSEHFIQVEKENIVNAYNFCESNPNICENIIRQAHKFVEGYASHPHGYEYMHFFLEALNELKSP